MIGLYHVEACREGRILAGSMGHTQLMAQLVRTIQEMFSTNQTCSVHPRGLPPSRAKSGRTLKNFQEAGQCEADDARHNAKWGCTILRFAARLAADSGKMRQPGVYFPDVPQKP